MTTLNDNSYLVSIVTPSFNSANYIERTIEGVMVQDYPRIEHIVVDGGSTDGTINILRRYPHIRWVSEPDRGQSDAINKGFRIARGDILAWLNADDTYNPGAVSTAVAWLRRYPEVGLVHSDYHVIDRDDRYLYRVQAIDFELDQIFLFNEVPGQFTAFWHRHVLDKVGYLDEDLHYVMDYDLWLRIAMTYPIKHIPDLCLANFRLYPGTKTTSNPEAFRVESDRILARAIASQAFTALPQATQVLCRASALRHRAGIACYFNEPVRAAALFRESAQDTHRLRSRDIQVLLWKFASCIQSPFVPDAINLMKELFDLALPPEVARLRRQAMGFVHHAYALHHFQNRRMSSTRQHMLKSFVYQPSFLKNRGMLSILIQTVLGVGAPARFRRYLFQAMTRLS